MSGIKAVCAKKANGWKDGLFEPPARAALAAMIVRYLDHTYLV